jgi:hypothetical protein
MRPKPQTEVHRELTARIPRGRTGSPQNMLRMHFYLFRIRGFTFEDSLARALAVVRTDTPDFVPLLLPPTTAAGS